MVSNEKYFENLIKVASHPSKPVLTVPILETLSIIAYKQPCSKADIEKIRGYSPDYAINKLLEYGLIEESGRNIGTLLESQGNVNQSHIQNFLVALTPFEKRGISIDGFCNKLFRITIIFLLVANYVYRHGGIVDIQRNM